MRRHSGMRWAFVAQVCAGTAVLTSAGSTEALADDLPRDLPDRVEEWQPRPGEPGSGRAREEFGPGQPQQLKAPLPRRPRSEEEEAAVEEIEGLFLRYQSASRSAAEALRDRIVVQAETGRDDLTKYYEREIRARQAKARTLRSKAIARYEEFLKLHPSDPAWTPEIMLRLGQLEFEAAAERFRRQEEAWEKELAAFNEASEEGKAQGDPPPPPVANYDGAVERFRGVVEGFPHYPYGDAALYMMGFLLLESEDFDGGRQAFLALACANHFSAPSANGSNVTPSSAVTGDEYGEDCVPFRPESKYLAESWLRVGEIHYDMDELDPALAAYRQAAKDKENEWYDEALIRMAWTLYLKREFRQAVEKLDEFVVYADAVKNTDDGAGAVELRGDAVRYLAKSYIEEDWDGDGATDALTGMARLDADYANRTEEPHVPEIYSALGDLLAYQTDYQKAIAIWQATLRRWPNTRTAPDIQLKILQSYLALQEKDLASEARDKLATAYLRGTPWFYANEDDPDAIARAFELAEDALVAAAIEHHEKAQRLKTEGDEAGAKREYTIAARAYEAYLERFPETDNSYEYRYQFADSLYFSDQYEKAAENFILVRDSNIDNRLQKDAASGVIFAREAQLEQAEKSNQLTLPPMPKDGMEGPFDPQPLPAEVELLQRAYDEYVAIFSDTEDAARYRYEAGSLSQRYNRFDESEPRFVAVLENHCAEDVAINAGYAIIDAHVVRKDLQGTREWTEKLAKYACGSAEESAKFAGELRTIGNAVRFQEASLLFEAGEFEAAADRYVALVDEAPNDPNADKALNNAAVAYEKIGRFASATRTYERIYTKYPDSEFADDALLRTGFNHARFFEFEEAVAKYLVLAEDEQYKDSEHRLIALKNAASLMENLQDYDRAADLFVSWSEKSSEPADKAEGLFRAAEITGKTGDHKKTIKAYEAYLKAYGSEPAAAERAVEAHLRIGLEYEAMGKDREADKAYVATIAEFEKRNLEAATDAADFPAQAQFMLAERSLEKVLDVKLKGQGKQLEKNIKALFDNVIDASKAYDQVFPYRRLEWTLAGMYRRGFAFEDVAEKIRTAPVPKQLKEYSEAWFAYKDIVANEAQRFEDKAIALYEELIARSAQFKVNTEWTRRARERLNKYKPEDFPLLRDPALDMQVEDLR